MVSVVMNALGTKHRTAFLETGTIFPILSFFSLCVLSKSLSIYENNYIFQQNADLSALGNNIYYNPFWIFKIVWRCPAITALWHDIDYNPARLLTQQHINYWWKWSASDSDSVEHSCHHAHDKAAFIIRSVHRWTVRASCPVWLCEWAASYLNKPKNDEYGVYQELKYISHTSLDLSYWL